MAQTNEVLSADARVLIARQRGVLAAAQSAACGLARETLRMRVSRGLWQRLLPGVYLLQCGPPNPLQRALAAQLYAGEYSVITGPAALRLYGIGDAVSGLWDGVAPPAVGSAASVSPSGKSCASTAPIGAGSGIDIPAPPDADSPTCRVHLLIPHSQRRQNVSFVRVSRTTRMPEPVARQGLRLAPPARAAVDACSWCLEAPDAATADAFVETVVHATVSTGLAALADLEYELDQSPRRHTRPLRHVLTKARVREHAAATRYLFDSLRRNGPAGLLRYVAIYGERRLIAVAEAIWPSRALVATIDPQPYAVAELTRLGFAVIQIRAGDVVRSTAAVIDRISAALATRPEVTLPPGVALLPVGRPEPDGAAEASVTEYAHRGQSDHVPANSVSAGRVPANRVPSSRVPAPARPPWPGLNARGPAFTGAF